MAQSTLRLVNWGHRRATGPFPPLLARFFQMHPEIDIVADVRPLGDFEHQSIVDTACAYDFVVFDHPFCGDIAASGAFVPLDELGVDATLLAPERFIGSSLSSYDYEEHIWGAPIDGATQNALYRADLLGGDPLPARWTEVVELGGRLARRGLFLASPGVTPHAILAAAALMVSRGRPWSTDSRAPLAIDGEALRTALEDLARLQSYCAPGSLQWNSIDVHAAMVERDDIAYAPCVYGYATYGEADMRRRLSFAPFPAPNAAGTAIGGTAIAVSRSCAALGAAALFVGFLLSEEAQCAIIPRHHGQPALRAAWDAPSIDARFNGYFSATRNTMKHAWTRPRLPGYPLFQKRAGLEVQRALAGDQSIAAATENILGHARHVNQGSPGLAGG